jgi:hypothetical protein
MMPGSFEAGKMGQSGERKKKKRKFRVLRVTRCGFHVDEEQIRAPITGANDDMTL